MAIIKCKMCGGDLNITEGMSVAECEYCGTRQTVPNVDNEKKVTLFGRANRLRLACEFDKAASVYESIVADFPEEAEAYWGLVLCRYGIEYVDDPATGKKVPTCHRSSFESILEDTDFEQACENADAVARKVYREEAKAIEEIRKGILEVSGKEQPYDIFICYKETDENGERTVDSVLAQDVYDALSEKGYRVFFSRITLEDKLGTEYEPYIFAALNSAKIMLAFGTDYEYFNAVWVKNEWSRFLKLMVQDKSKHLIPCYKDVDAYDLPKEFQKLQAQDMGKVGAVQDLLRGIDKLLGKGASVQPAVAPAPAANGPTVGSLLKRGQMFLADGEWNNAAEYFDKVLDIDPENGAAYAGKLCAALKFAALEQIAECDQMEQVTGNRNYQKAVQFGDGDLQAKLQNYLAAAKERQIQHAYQKLCNRMEQANTEAQYRNLAEEFESLNGYSDAVLKKEACIQKAEQAKQEAERAAKAKAERQAKEKAEKIAELAPLRARNQKAEGLIAPGQYHTVGLRTDGTVVAVGHNNKGQCNVSGWRDIVAISVSDYHTVGLRSDGTVVATGENGAGQCDVSKWRNITAIAVSNIHTVGLRSNGTVVVAGKNQYGECEVEDWKNIVKIGANFGTTVGLRENGTIVRTNFRDEELDEEFGEDDDPDDEEGNTGIVSMVVENNSCVGLRSDGSIAFGSIEDEMLSWKPVVACSMGDYHTVGLYPDGTVVAAGDNDNGQCNVTKWRDIVAISAGYAHTVGLRADGTVVAVGQNDEGQCDVAGWQDIVAIHASNSYTVGLRSDGKAVAAGWNLYGECNVEDWKLFDSIDTLKDKAKRYQEFCAAMEAKRVRRQADLEAERARLQAELPNLKGLFSGFKRKEIQSRLVEIEAELKKL